MADEGLARVVAQPTPDWWRPTRALATWLTWLLVAQAALGLVSLAVVDSASTFVRYHDLIEARIDDRDATADRIEREINDDNDSGIGSAFGLVQIGLFVLLIIWTWRSAHNAQALGRTGARLSPGWAIGAWFIPLANFVLVYLLVSDLWRSADPRSERGAGWRAFPGSLAVRAWWSAYVVGFGLSVVTVGLAFAGEIGESTARTLWIVASLLSAAASLLAIVVVRDITARQEALQSRDPAPTERSLASHSVDLAAGDGPGWYADPGRAFDHRFWDGSTWTEHVSVGGVPSTAPVVAPDWYPDPTGRFHWRYWTGYEWTEHASRDQELFIDPIDGAPQRDVEQ